MCSSDLRWISGEAGEGAAPKWNFHKYLIDRSGNRVTGYGSSTTPDDAKLVRDIEKLLAESS